MKALVGAVELREAGGAAFTAQRMRLLEAIASLGSLSRAAAALPMSYRAAWDALDEMNRLADAPLVERRTGGRHGGGTRLTAHGERMLALYRALEATQQTVLDRLPAAAAGTDRAALRTLVRRLAVRSSARNQFPATVAALRDDGGRVGVSLDLAGAERIVVNVTPHSVQTMALDVGVEVHVLLKAPAIDVRVRAPRPSADFNVLAGEVVAIERGRASTQFELRSAGGLLLVASMARPAAALQCPGVAAWARFATDSAILLRYDG